MNPISWAITQMAAGAQVRQSTWSSSIYISQDLSALPMVRYVRGGTGLLPWLVGTPYHLFDDGTSTWEAAT